MISALPGFVLAFAVLGLREPTRAPATTWRTASSAVRFSAFPQQGFWTVTLGAAMMTFAIGGLQVWMPTFLVRMRHLPLERANTVFGGMTVVSGTVALCWEAGWATVCCDEPLRVSTGLGCRYGALDSRVVVAIYFPGTAMYPAIFLGSSFCC